MLQKEIELISISIKDFLTPKMLKYSLLPFIITVVIMYVLFFYIAGVGFDTFSATIQSSQTTMQDGVPHTETITTYIQNSSIIQFLMSYTITSWIASFLVYAIGSFFVLYTSIFIAVLVLGFLTPFILKELQKRHYKNVEMIGFSNPIEGIFLSLKYLLIMMLLFIFFIPFYLIPVINIVALNFPLYYFFHKMINYDIASSITTRDEFKQIKFFNKNILRVKTAFMYLLSLIPFGIFFISVFYVIYLGHTYFMQTKKLRDMV